MNRTVSLLVAVMFAASILATPSQAQSPLVTIDTVTVGDSGNRSDSSGYGAVNDVFALGKYEVTIGQYTVFLNAVASVTAEAHLADLWHPKMSSDPRISGISRAGSGTAIDPYIYAGLGNTNRPISYLSWIDAARFANWMHNGATIGASTETGAYTLNGTNTGIILRNPGAKWWIPSEDEWYKAAYYKGGGAKAGYWDYPTQSDKAPGNFVGSATNQANYWIGVFSVTQSASYPSSTSLSEVGAFAGSMSAYGTYDQGGNLLEWNDAVIGGVSRGLRGGDWNGNELGLQSTTRGDGGTAAPTYEDDDIGFRLAAVPASSITAATVKFLPPKRTVPAGSSATLMLVVGADSMEEGTVTVNLSYQPALPGAPATQTLEVPAKKRANQKPMSVRRKLTVPIPATASGSVVVTASVLGGSPSTCNLTIKPRKN